MGVVLKTFLERERRQRETMVAPKTRGGDPPLVSVVVTTYMQAAFIRQCLDSILMQKTSFAYEILIGEDGSTDGTREICLAYARRYPGKIRLFLRNRKESHYRCEDGWDCRFNGKWLVRAARGRYLALCEGDDYWSFEGKLAEQVAVLESDPHCNLVFHEAAVLYEDGPHWVKAHRFSDFPWCFRDGERRTYDLNDFLGSPLAATASVMLRPPAGIYTADWMFRVPGGDMLLFAMAVGAGRAVFLDQVWSHYRKHRGGITRTHAGAWLHLGRLRLYLGLWLQYHGVSRAALMGAIRRHLRDLRQPEIYRTDAVCGELVRSILATEPYLDRPTRELICGTTTSRCRVAIYFDGAPTGQVLTVGIQLSVRLHQFGLEPLLLLPVASARLGRVTELLAALGIRGWVLEAPLQGSGLSSLVSTLKGENLSALLCFGESLPSWTGSLSTAREFRAYLLRVRDDHREVGGILEVGADPGPAPRASLRLPLPALQSRGRLDALCYLQDPVWSALEATLTESVACNRRRVGNLETDPVLKTRNVVL